MTWRLIVLLASVSIAGSGCGSPTSPGAVAQSRAGSGTDTGTSNPPSGGSSGLNCSTSKGTLTAIVDGTPWTALCVPAASWVAGNLAVGAANDVETLTLTANVTVPGNYTGQIGAAVGSLTRGTGGAAWTSGPGGTISLVIARLDLDGASGTFSFAAGPLPGTPATGTRTVSNGTFDVKF